jgi:hypothetical protein
MKPALAILVMVAALGCGSNETPAPVVPPPPDAAPPDAARSCDLRPGVYTQTYFRRSTNPTFCPELAVQSLATNGTFADWTAAPACTAGCTCTANRDATACTFSFSQTCASTGVQTTCDITLASQQSLSGICAINLIPPAQNLGSCYYDSAVTFLHP